MVRPLYMLCSEAGVIDKDTNLESVFNIFDVLQVTKKPASEGAGLLPLLKMRVTAVWQCGEEPPGAEFEHSLIMFLPGSQKPRTLQESSFTITQPRQRFIIGISGPPFVEPGVIRIQSRVRPVGTSKWVKQECRLEVRVTTITSEANGSQIPMATRSGSKRRKRNRDGSGLE